METLWTVADVANYLKVSRSWIYQKSRASGLPSFKVSSEIRFLPSLVDKWRKERENEQPNARTTQNGGE